MVPSLIARFVDAFIAGFFKTMKEKVIDVLLLLATLAYWLLSGKLSAHFWESTAPWVWVVCAIIVWHAISAARLLSKEVSTKGGLGSTTSIIVSQYGKPLELQEAEVPKYRAKIVGFVMLIAILCIACSAGVWRLAYGSPQGVGAQPATPPEETLFATVEMAIVSLGRPSLSLTGFWHLHSMNPQLCAITPIDVLAFIRVEATSSRPLTIAGYTVEAGDSKSGKWTLLRKVPLTYGQLIFTGRAPGTPHVGNTMTFPATGTHIYLMNLSPKEADYANAAVIGLNSLDTQLTTQVSAHSPARGWASFQGEFQGDWRITIIDSLNKSHQFIVPQIRTSDDSDVMLRVMKVVGVADVSRCEKRQATPQ